MSYPESILVRSPNWIGDQILSYPFFHFLRQSFPASKIGVSCAAWVSTVQFRNLVDGVYPLPQTTGSSLRAKWQALEQGAEELRKLGCWDLGISLPNSFSAAWLLFRAQVRRRRGYSMDGRGFLLHEAIAWPRSANLHRSEAYLRLLPSPPLAEPPVSQFWGAHPENVLDPKIPGVLSEFDADRAWPDACPIEPPVGPYWILAPGSTAESRRWPVVQFMALAKKIASTTGYPGYVVGGPAEKPIAQNLTTDPSLRLTDWTGSGAVSRYWKIFRHAQWTVSNDSGLAHVAALCGSAVHVVWGGGNPKRTEPMGPGKVQISFNPIDCWPCERNLCMQSPSQKLACLSGISAEEIWKEIYVGIKNRDRTLQ